MLPWCGFQSFDNDFPGVIRFEKNEIGNYQKKWNSLDFTSFLSSTSLRQVLISCYDFRFWFFFLQYFRPLFSIKTESEENFSKHTHICEDWRRCTISVTKTFHRVSPMFKFSISIVSFTDSVNLVFRIWIWIITESQKDIEIKFVCRLVKIDVFNIFRPKKSFS